MDSEILERCLKIKIICVFIGFLVKVVYRTEDSKSIIMVVIGLELLESDSNNKNLKT